jgi:hypothetical protein
MGEQFFSQCTFEIPFCSPSLKKGFMEKLKSIGKILVGTLLIPTLFILFYLDRIVLMALPWKPAVAIQQFYKQIDNILMSLYRVITVIAMILLLALIF